jgi:hypothetical protein
MKTAMQELIEIFNHELKLGEATLSNDEGYMLKWAIFNAKTLLEKEKEDIEIAFDLGRDEVTSAFIIDGEDYYNKKFNQKETLEQWKAKFTHHCAIKPKTK